MVEQTQSSGYQMIHFKNSGHLTIHAHSRIKFLSENRLLKHLNYI